MASFLEIALCGAGIVLLLPVGVLFLEVSFAVGARRRAPVPAGARPRLTVLMPAHNEGSIIASSLRTVVGQMSARDRVVVVADNCTDDTAAVAATEGAEVLIRSDTSRVGKGYALDFGIRHLERDRPDVVIIVDADCRVAPDTIDRIARLCIATLRPVQALYLMGLSKDAGPMARIGEFAWIVKNHVRPLGWNRLGLPCQLMGTGMAFPWATIRAAPLATAHIVEDLKLGIDLARGGTPPLFCPEALVTSTFPASGEGKRTQRARWEHGYLSVIVSDAMGLCWQAVRRLDLPLLAMALDLCVPPLALLLLQVAAVWLASALYYGFTGTGLPLGIATACAVLLVVAVLLAWTRYGRQVVSFGSLLLAVAYAVKKIPLYAAFFIARQVGWVRSKRDDDA